MRGGTESKNLATVDLLALIDEQRCAVRESLAGSEDAVLARRPASGRWSALENVRHLLFAEQKHLGGLVPRGWEWSPLGYTPRTMREARDVSRAAGSVQPSLTDILAAWDELHQAIAAVLVKRDSPEVRAALARNLMHLRAHVSVITRLVRDG